MVRGEENVKTSPVNLACQFFYPFGSLSLFSPAKPKIWPPFGHWQAAISSPESDCNSPS